MNDEVARKIQAQRMSLVRRLELRLDRPLALLGVVWLVLLVVEFTVGLGPLLRRVGVVIWVIFIADFALKFILAPSKPAYLRRHWLTAFSLAIPALRALRALRMLRAARALRGFRLLRLLASWNRGMRALGLAMRRRGFGYVMLLTLLVLVSGAGGMYAFEREAPAGRGIEDYGTALWWTAMILTTMGSEYWPQTAEGRLLCLLLAVYGFTVFGYVTATLATFFVSRDMAAAGAWSK
jgi:voltage-gated potassium channel